MREEFKIGVKVSFKDSHDNVQWFLKNTVGEVINTTEYGPEETMVTVDFKGRRAHVAHTKLDIVS